MTPTATIEQTRQLPIIRLSHTGIQPAFVFNKRTDGFRLKHDTALAEGDVLISAPLPEKWEDINTMAELVERTDELAMYDDMAGQLQAEKLLSDEEIIQPGWEEFTHVFLGTEWLGPGNCRPIPCLTKIKSGWTLYFLFLGDKIPEDCRLVYLARRP